MASQGMHLQVEVRKKLNLWDYKTSNIYLSVGNGQQPLQWLGYVACNYVAFENGIVTTKCVPQGVLVKEKLVDIEQIIKETCIDGEKVIVEYSNGPEAFTQCWEGQISKGDQRMRNSLIKVGYDLGDNDEMYDLINEVDALVTRVVDLIYDVVEEIDILLHGKKVEIKHDEAGLLMDIVTIDVEPHDVPLIQFQLDEEGNQVLDENGNPIPLPPPLPDPPKDEETYIEISLLYFEEYDYGILQKIQSALGDTHGDIAQEEFRMMREVLKGHDVQLQAIFLWYGSKGVELHNKDFGFLTFEQWQLLWKELNIPSETLDSSLINPLWYELKDFNQMYGCYQLDFYGFYAAIMHLTLALYTGYNSTKELSCLLDLVVHFIEDILVFNFEPRIKSRLKSFYDMDTSKYQSVYKDIEETIQEATYGRHFTKEKMEKLEAEQKESLARELGEKKEIRELPPPPPLPNPKEKNKKKDKEEPKPIPLPNLKEKNKKKNKEEPKPIVMEEKCTQILVPEKTRNLIPYFREWKIMGAEWDPEIATLAIIYALENTSDMLEFTPLPTDDLTFGMTEVERMITAASHAAYEKVPIKRVSEFSFFKTHLNESLQRGGLAKPFYASYEEKKRYLASICLRYGGKPAPQPSVFNKK